MRRLALCLLLLLLMLSSVCNGSEKSVQNVRMVKPRSGVGFTLLSPQDGRVLGYSPQGNLDRALQNPGFQLLLEALSQSDSQPQFRVMDSSLPDSVGPLLTDTWDQFEPYNALTPTVDGQHCAVGCVALALAQVLRYWKAPCREASHTYVDSLGCKQELTVNFPYVTGYDYDHMLDSYADGQYTSEQLEAVARLLADCGVAVNMKYRVASSSANTILQPPALVDYFGFDTGLQHFFRDFYTRQEWESMLRRNLAAGWPILMAAQSPSLAHAFVCDGYDAEGLFHLNLGMGGDADGFYYLPYLTPKQPEWYDLDSPEGGMNLLQYAIMDIHPAQANLPHYAYAFAGMELVDSVASRQGELRVCTRDLSNVGWNAGGHVALVLKQGDQLVDTLLSYPHDFLLEEVDDTTYTDTLAFRIPAGVGEGTYRILPAFQQEDETWEEARTSVGTPNYLLAEVTAESVRLHHDTQQIAWLTLQDYQFPDTIERYTKPEFSFTIQNHQAEYCGRFYIILEPVEQEGTYRVIQYEGLTLGADEQTCRYFHRTTIPVAEGDYNLRVFYDQNLFNDSLIWLSEEPLKIVHVVSNSSGIASVQSENPGECYDLQGRRITLPHREEIYIEKKNNSTRKILKQQ